MTARILVLTVLLSLLAGPAIAADRKPPKMVSWGAELGVVHRQFTATVYYTDGTQSTGDAEWKAGFDGAFNLQAVRYGFATFGNAANRMNIGGLLDITAGAWRHGFHAQVHAGVDLLLMIFRFQFSGGGALFLPQLPNNGEPLLLGGGSFKFVGGIAIPLKKYERGTLELNVLAGVQTTVGTVLGFRAPVTVGIAWMTR